MMRNIIGLVWLELGFDRFLLYYFFCVRLRVGQTVLGANVALDGGV